MLVGLVGLLLQIQPIQAGVTVKPETVTVGQHFVATVRVRAPLGATIQFPVGTAIPAAVDTAGLAVRHDTTTASYLESTTKFELAAWDTGRVKLGLGDVVVETEGAEHRIPLDSLTVYVRSILPKDSAGRVPKPPRPVITIVPFDWRPWIEAAIIVAIVGLLTGLWAWFRRRGRRPVAPLSWADREFARVEAMGLLEAGKSEQYAISMTGVLRGYLSRRVSAIRSSATTREIADVLRVVPAIPYERTLRVLETVDLLKFARQTMTRDHAQAIGNECRAIVQLVDEQVRRAEAAARAAADDAAKRSASTARAA